MKKVIFAGCVGTLLLVGVLNAASKSAEVSEESIGLRKVDLYSEEKVKPEETKYATKAAGTSKKIQRAYENAPPMIPHDISEYGEIAKDNNPCKDCHMPEVAPSMKATPIPMSHFMNFRTGEKLNDLYQGRFNCTACHAPQSVGKPLVDNNFKPDFKSKKAKGKSNLVDVLNEGVVVSE